MANISAADLLAILGALTALVIAIGNTAVSIQTHGRVVKIDTATNGALNAQKDLVNALQSTRATPEEIALRVPVDPMPVPPAPAAA